MENSIVTITLAILTILGNCGWVVSRAKYRQEVRRSKANAEKDELDLSTEFVKQFRAQIYNPLAEELTQLRAAIATITNCPKYPDCPVSQSIKRMQGKSKPYWNDPDGLMGNFPTSTDKDD